MFDFRLKDIKAVLFDLDGTIYFGSKPIDGANEATNFFRKNGINVFFASNNSAKRSDQLNSKLIDIGVDCKQNEIINSGLLAAHYILNKGYSKVYVIGTKELCEEFLNNKITVCESDDESDIDAVIIGYNPFITHAELSSGIRVAKSAKELVACNRERTFPGENQKLLAGCGAVVAAVEWCANRKVDIVVGKPESYMVKYVCNILDIKPNEILVVGDTDESDGEMARRSGSHFILVDNTHKSNGNTIKQSICIKDLLGCVR